MLYDDILKIFGNLLTSVNLQNIIGLWSLRGIKNHAPYEVGFLKLLLCISKFIVANLRKPVNRNLIGGGNLLENIKRLCRSRGISLAELERACGFGKKSIYAWAENSPSIDRVKLVADYFGVTVDALLNPEQDSA